jgi:hypothetical protein
MDNTRPPIPTAMEADDIHPAHRARVSTASTSSLARKAATFLAPSTYPPPPTPISTSTSGPLDISGSTIPSAAPEALRQCPLPLSDLHTTPQDIPREQIPSIIKTNALDPDNKLRAYAAADHSYTRLEAPEIRDTLFRIAAVKDADIVGRPKAKVEGSRGRSVKVMSAPVPPSPALTAIRDGSLSPETQEEVKGKGSRSPNRQIVSAPPTEGNYLQLHVSKNRLDRRERIPGSPIGNAFSGEHYWEGIPPQPVTPYAIQDKSTSEGELSCQPPPSTDAYNFVREAASASDLLQKVNANFANLPVPHDISAKLFALADEESRAVSSWTIEDEAVLANHHIWLQVQGNHHRTILDAAKDALHMIRRRKENLLQLPVEAWLLVHAVRFLEEKEGEGVKGVEEISDDKSDDASDEELPKSLAQIKRESKKTVATTFSRNVSHELAYDQLEGKRDEGVVRRGGLGRTVDAEERRKKGKAPSALDLQSWQEHLKAMEEGNGEQMSSGDD